MPINPRSWQLAAIEKINNVMDPRRRKGNAATATIDPKKEDVALVLIDRGLDINAVDVHSGTPLWYAASAGMEITVTGGPCESDIE